MVTRVIEYDTDDDNDGCEDSIDDNPRKFSEDSDLDGNANRVR